jgi:hypothetical protein
MGMLVSVYRNKSADTTNGGVSATLDRFIVANVEGPFMSEPTATDVLVLEQGPLDSARLIPAVYNDSRDEWEPINRALGEWVTFGGNYAGTSDSRFCEATSFLTGGTRLDLVKVFDRVEAV